MWTRALTEADARHIATNMREYDRKEVVAELGPDFVEELVGRLTLPGGIVYAFGIDQPIAFVGARPYTAPDVWCASMLATDEWPKVAAGVSAFVVNELIPLLYKFNIRRVECYSVLGHVEAHRWLRWLGAKPKGIRPTLGKRGEKFIRFTWERASVCPRNHRQSAPRPQRGDRASAGGGAASAGHGGAG